MKKLLAILLTVAVLLSVCACAAPAAPAPAPAAEPATEAPAPAAVEEPAAAPAPEQGKVYNIYCWNDEFQTRFQKYFVDAGLVPEGVTINWVITPNADNAYQNKLDEALLAQDGAAADDKVDLFLIEADYALKYVNTDYSLDVYKDVGLTEADTAGMYGYTKDVCTDANGALQGLTWQACPAGLIYRRSIAEAVLGKIDDAVAMAALDSALAGGLTRHRRGTSVKSASCTITWAAWLNIRSERRLPSLSPMLPSTSKSSFQTS